MNTTAHLPSEAEPLHMDRRFLLDDIAEMVEADTGVLTTAKGARDNTGATTSVEWGLNYDTARQVRNGQKVEWLRDGVRAYVDDTDIKVIALANGLIMAEARFSGRASAELIAPTILAYIGEIAGIYFSDF